MKNSVLTASMVAVGLLSVTAAQAQRQDKPWTISAAVRGFYDDNIATSPSNPAPGGVGAQDSFGLEFRPSVGFYIDRGATTFDASYELVAKYYEDRSDSTDYSHEANVAFTHAFSEIHRVSISDNFVAAQEGELLAAGTVFRSNSDAFRNVFRVAHEAELSRLISTEISYRNTFVDYEADGIGSFSSLLDRWEHRFGTDLRWQVQPQTRALVGYMFDVRDQTSDDPIAVPPTAIRTVLPDERDSRAHYLFVGGDHNFSPQLSGSVRVGAQYTEYPNAVTGDSTVISPYGDASLSYEYRKDSSFTFGIRHDRSQTDVGITGGLSAPTTDSENTTLYAVVDHAITARLSANFAGRYRLSQFKGGAADSQRETYVILGGGLEYAINAFLSAEAGYSYTRLDSDLASRSFSRNRVFVGLRATY